MSKTLISEIDYNSSANYLAGRVIGLVEKNTSQVAGIGPDERGFILQDDSGRIFVTADEETCADLPHVGDIVFVGTIGIQPGKVNAFADFEVLVPCRTDFFISKNSPNYKKIIIDLNLKEQLIKRTKILHWIREFFLQEGFIETDTPELVALPGMEPYLDIFKTEFKPAPPRESDKKPMYLITSPEYAMKKLLVGGFEKIFQITKAFRNKETNGIHHNPEFTILEWYKAYCDYKTLMYDIQSLILFLFEKLYHDQQYLEYGEHKIHIHESWKRLKVIEAFEVYAHISPEIFEDIEALRKTAQKKGYQVDANTSFDDIFYIIFLNEIEPKLGLDVPTILYEYPISMAALARPCPENPKYAERFELYIAGMELCNCFSDLNNAVEQKKRLKNEKQLRQQLQKDDYPIDDSFIEALELGMPPCAGNAMGVDRLIMLLTNTTDINNILFFPHRDLAFPQI